MAEFMFIKRALLLVVLSVFVEVDVGADLLGCLR